MIKDVIKMSAELGKFDLKRIDNIAKIRLSVIKNLNLDESISSDELRFAVAAISKINGKDIEYANSILTGLSLQPLNQKQFDGARIDIVKYK